MTADHRPRLSGGRLAAALVAALMVTAVLGPVGLASAQTVSFTQTVQGGDTTVAPGETFTIEATIDYSDVNGPAIDATLPDGWTVTSHTDDGGTYGPPEPAWLWLEGDSDGVSGSHTVTYTVQVPSDATSGDYTIAGEGSAKNPADSSDVVANDDITITVEDTGNTAPTIAPIADQSVISGENVVVPVSASDADGDSVTLSLSQSPGFVTLANGEISIDPASGDAANSPYTVEVTADDGTTTTTESFQLTVGTATSTTSGTPLARVNAGGSTISATDGGPDWTGVTGTSTDGPLVSVSGSNGNYNDGDAVTAGSEVPSSTPPEVYNAERYGEMTWEFDVTQGSEVEVRLYLSNQFPQANSPGDRQYNVAIEGDQVLTEYDPVQDVDHATGTVKAFTVTEDDGTLTVSFTPGAAENPQVNAIEVVDVGATNTPPTIDAISDQTVTEGDSATVPVSASDDDGDTVSLSLTQSPDFVTLSNGEVTIAPQSGDAGTYTVEVMADDGTDTVTETFQLTVEEPAPTTGSALVEILPDSGNVDASTYGSGSYQVTNTGEKEIVSVSFNLDTATLPDMVFDPQGTAGDPTGEGLNIADEGGTGITTQAGTGEAFSQPHNGQDGDDGYDVMTVEFDDFQPGETATFWADNDPTSIKGATVSSQEAGPVSGLELARSTVTVEYADGTTQTTQLMGDGSNGGATAVVNSDEAPAPTIGAEGVSLDSNALDGYHSGATVSEASQTITLSGEPGETFTLVHVEGELSLSNVPDADGDGEPGYEIEALEANNIVAAEYYSGTFDSNGEATVPVTLTNSPDDDDEAGFNYFVAAHGQASGDMGLASNVVVLKYAPTQQTSASVAINPNSGIEASTYGGGSYQVTNTGDTNIQTLTLDLSETMLPDMVFDPFNTAGDDVGKEFTLDSGDVTVQNVEYTNFHNGQDNEAGYDTMVVTLSGFEPGETMTFSVDNDPTSIDTTDLGSQAAGPVSGLEITGGTVSVGSGSGPIEATIVGDSSAGGSMATVMEDTDESKPSIGVEGVSLSSTTLSPRHSAATVADAQQTITISGAPANAEVTLLRVEGELNLNNVPTGYDIEEYEANKANQVQYYPVTTDSNGEATVDVTLTDTGAVEESGLNYFTAWVEEPDGDTGPISDYAVLQLNAPPTADAGADQTVDEGTTVTLDATGSSDTDGSVTSYSWMVIDDAGTGVTVSDTSAAQPTFTVSDVSSDTTLTFEVEVTDDDGSTATDTVSVTVQDTDPGIPPIGNFDNAPTDPDGDGKFEDVNGDGDVNTLDAQAIFANQQDPVVQNNVAAFDFNDDGSVNVLDAQAIFANGVGV